MAMQVATIAIGAGAIAAAAASEARAEPIAAQGSGPDVASIEAVSTHGWSCWGGPISRGPLAPPAQSEADFERLLAEVPS